MARGRFVDRGLSQTTKNRCQNSVAFYILEKRSWRDLTEMEQSRHNHMRRQRSPNQGVLSVETDGAGEYFHESQGSQCARDHHGRVNNCWVGGRCR